MCQHHSSPPAPSLPTSASGGHVCKCGGHKMPKPTAEVRWVERAGEMELPAVPFPSTRVLAVAGAQGLRTLVRRHHQLLRGSSIGHLFSQDEAAFAALVARVEDYVLEVCGAAAEFSQTEGSTCMRTRHFPFSIDEAARDIWLSCLWQALYDVGFAGEIREEYWDWMEAFSVRMVNRRTTKAQPLRIPYAAAKDRFDLTTLSQVAPLPAHAL